MVLNQLKTILLLGVLSAVLIAIGGSLGPQGLFIASAFALVLNVGAYFFSDRLVLRMHRAEELSPTQAPRLHAMMAELAERAGIPKPRLFRIPDWSANAFATGRNPANGVVAVTDGILDVLDERELRGVLAHELAHIKNRDILVSTIAAVIAGAVAHIASIVQWSAFFGGRGDEEESGGSAISTLVLALVAPIAATLLQLGVSRQREYLADATAARLAGDADGLARALAKLSRAAHARPAETVEPATASLFIVSPLAGREGLMSLFSTHPPMEERIRRLQALARGLLSPRAA